MRTKAALFLIALALGATIRAPGAGAQPTAITACQTISQPGWCVLKNNLVATSDCLIIAADFVTIDLAGFSISGNGAGTGILSNPANFGLQGIAVRNGSVSHFMDGVNIEPKGIAGSIIEGLRVFQNTGGGIAAGGLVRGNIVGNNGGVGIEGYSIATVTGNYSTENNVGIASGKIVSGNTINHNQSSGIITDNATVTGNNAIENDIGIVADTGSTVIGNSTGFNHRIGISVVCPSNVIENTAANNFVTNLQTSGAGCNTVNNVAP